MIEEGAVLGTSVDDETIPGVTIVTIKRALFASEHVCATVAADEAMREMGIEPRALLDRHFSGDWGECGAEERALNEYAIRHTGEETDRILSVYRLGPANDQETFYVITEWDRSVTTILLPSDY